MLAAQTKRDVALNREVANLEHVASRCHELLVHNLQSLSTITTRSISKQFYYERFAAMKIQYNNVTRTHRMCAMVQERTECVLSN